MGFQEIIVAIIFAAALFYVVRIIYNSLKAKSGCGSGCKCGVDFSEVNLPQKKDQ